MLETSAAPLGWLDKSLILLKLGLNTGDTLYIDILITTQPMVSLLPISLYTYYYWLVKIFTGIKARQLLFSNYSFCSEIYCQTFTLPRHSLLRVITMIIKGLLITFIPPFKDVWNTLMGHKSVHNNYSWRASNCEENRTQIKVIITLIHFLFGRVKK